VSAAEPRGTVPPGAGTRATNDDSSTDGPASLAWVDRVVSGYDLDGPRVRMGVLWFAVAVGAALVGVGAVAVLFGVVAGAAALQTAAAWRKVGRRPSRLVAGVGALVLPLAAAFGIALTGLVVLTMAVGAVVAAYLDPRRRHPLVVPAGCTVRSGFFVGLAAASVVFVARTDSAALVTLLVLVSAYEVGDYLVGTGAATPVEGPVAGIAAVLVLTFAVAVFEFAPFETGSAWVFGGLAAALAPLGRFAAPVLAPSPDARVPALRRLDSYLLVAPVWAWVLWGYLL
jgi:hypothetical protein